MLQKTLLKFTKMQALGNDFVVIDAINQKVNLTVEEAKKIADRHLGIGCDQILLVEAPIEPSADFSYTLFNADGSDGGFSGNGIRCLAKFVYEKKLTTKRDIVIGTKSRRLRAFLTDDDEVKVDIGQPIFVPEQIPLATKIESLRYNLELGELGKIIFGSVSVGNPHAVVLVPKIDETLVATLGPAISKHEFFPKEVNVNFMEIIDRKHIRLRVYERGSGETLACGSGSCASVIIGKIWGLLDSTVVVEFAIGNLTVNWNGPDNPIFIKGPASLVFDGFL